MARARIRIIEDDQDLTHVLTDILTVHGYDVEVRDSAFGAAALVRDYHPVAVLLDLGLPFRAGSSLLTELKADPSTARIPVLIMSGIPESLTEERRAMAAAGLTKPFEITALLDALPTASAPGRRN